jgi:signal transduction histidine kinase/ActR/RegA family two-component response regulator/HAMP domain-containing protein
MYIATRLKLAALLTIAAVAVVAALQWSTTQRVGQELAKDELAGDILNAVSSVRYLTFEYVLFHQERTLAQWKLRHASRSKLLATTTAFIGTEDEATLDGLRHTNETVQSLFDELVANRQGRDGDQGQSAAQAELEIRLVGQIMTRAQSMISGARSLSVQSQAGVREAQHQASIAVAVLGGIVVLLISVTMLLVHRSVIRPLAKLREGMKSVGGGDLEFRLGVTNRDEFGELALAFDAMTDKLNGTTVSRNQLIHANDVLQTEISVRLGAEQRVRAQLARLALLDQITRAIGERQDLQSIYQVAIRSVEEGLPVDFACICRFDAVDNALTVIRVGVHSQALAMELAFEEQSRIAIDQNGLSRCVRGELVYESDIQGTPFAFTQRLARGGLRSLVMAPLQSESRVFGILVAARQLPQSFDSGDCEFLSQLSAHVALAARQAELHGALQQAYDDLRQTQQTVMQRERLRSLGQMASGIAHDINNALSPVALYTETLLERETNLSERGRGYLVTIARAIDDVAATVARMREFYRQREPQLVPTSVQLNLLVRHVIDLTRARWSDMPQQRGTVIRLDAELSPDLPAILGVESEVREALVNLVFNAVDAMPDGGELTLRTRSMWPRARGMDAAERIAVVEVSDTGVGMDEDTRRRCLEPFFTTKGERGTGLGLAMVYGVAQRHGADVDIDSAVGHGTTVRLSFPVPAAPLPASAAPPPPEVPTSRLRILIVDDDPLMLKSLCDSLELDGHVVVTANGGQTGIDAFQTAHRTGDVFDVVFTDLGMPYVDGRKVASAVKASAEGTPVILLTGWGQRLLADGESPAHVDVVLSKPPKIREIRAALAQLTRSTDRLAPMGSVEKTL